MSRLTEHLAIAVAETPFERFPERTVASARRAGLDVLAIDLDTIVDRVRALDHLDDVRPLARLLGARGRRAARRPGPPVIRSGRRTRAV